MTSQQEVRASSECGLHPLPTVLGNLSSVWTAQGNPVQDQGTGRRLTTDRAAKYLAMICSS